MRKQDRKMMKRATTMISVATPHGERQKCYGCGNTTFRAIVKELRNARICPGCGRYITLLLKVGGYARTTEDNYADAVLMAQPRCQHDLLPRMRHVHAGK